MSSANSDSRCVVQLRSRTLQGGPPSTIVSAVLPQRWGCATESGSSSLRAARERQTRPWVTTARFPATRRARVVTRSQTASTSSVELAPALSTGRRVARSEDVLLELGVRSAADVSEVPLTQARVEAQRCAGCRQDTLRCHTRAGLVAGQNVRDPEREQSAGEAVCLCDPPLVERCVRGLDHARRVQLGLAVANQQNRHVDEGSRGGELIGTLNERRAA